MAKAKQTNAQAAPAPVSTLPAVGATAAVPKSAPSASSTKAVKPTRRAKATNIYFWFKTLHAIPLIGAWIFSFLVSFSSPYTGSIPLRLTHLTPGTCKGRMRLRRSISNPFGSAHAAALINMGEAVGGAAMVSMLEEMEGDGGKRWRGIPVRLEGIYRKKARGVLTAETSIPEPKGGVFPEEADVVEVLSTIKDEEGEVVCEVRADWMVSVVAPRIDKKRVKKE
ncbi:hypothetical protein HK101_005438 [Irineochytrium annulatum]|nr:hypothetical protein HK101_005438 [Irineochytrium annulatum]